jgi:hypothetical protein
MSKMSKVLWMLLTACLPFLAKAQYSMHEMGVGAGLGFTAMPSQEEFVPGGHVSGEYFFSHYACGKAFGFHVQGGFNFSSVSGSNGAWLGLPLSSSGDLSILSLDAGFFGKIRLHEYHRPKEGALLLGPKLQSPLMARYSADGNKGNLGQIGNMNRIIPGLHLSLQLRRPASKKKSYFIEPGVEYYLLPVFKTSLGGPVQQMHFFIKFGYAFWDQRG